MKKRVLQKGILIPVLIICTIFVLFTPFVIVGSKSIFAEIETIENVPHRNLEISKDQNGITTIKNDESNADIKILQLSDLHICCSYFTKERDAAIIKAIVKVVNFAQPDLIVISGDMLFPFIFRSYCTDNETMAKAFISTFEKIGIPYAMIFGNHDAESLAKWNKSQLSDYFSSSTLQHSLYESGEPMSGIGNYAIKLLNNDGTLSQVAYFIDNGEGDIKQNQIDWYSRKVSDFNTEADRSVPSIIFMHIPLYEYQLAYEQSNNDFLYGYLNESISSINPECRFFDTIKALASTTAIFCGHDHRNTCGMLYEGILLSYCPTLDYNAYLNFYENEELMGGQIISLNSNDGTVDVNQIYLLDIP